MRRLARIVTLLTATAWLAAACGDQPPVTAPDPGVPPQGPSFSISDGANGGNPHFYWLPPMVSNPNPTGTFDGGRSPAVTICELDGTECALTQPSGMPLVYTLSSGPGGELVTVSGDHYKVNWHTDEVTLDDTKFYRIEVTVGLQALGHADIDPVNKGKDLKNVDTNEYIGLVNGRTLPVKFRIEDGAIDEAAPVTSNVVADANPAPVGQGVTLTADVDDSGTGNSDIVSAEYRVDGGAYAAMAAQDGDFDSPTEAVTVALAGFASPGDRTVCVRGTDAAGNVGAETCITLSIEGFAWAQVSVGGNHACAVSTDGTPYCWGLGTNGEVGNGSAGAWDEPQLVAGGLTVSSINAGGSTCAITTGGDTYCWGPNSDGELGIGSAGPSELSPLLVSGGHTFVEVKNSGRSTCARTAAGATYCWGNNAGGGVGDGTFVDRHVPTAVVGGLAFDAITSGGANCGLTAAGEGYCWGQNVRSELGIGTTGGWYSTPQMMAGGHTFVDLEIWGNNGCGLEGDGDVYCWGTNWTGALGVAPIDVAGTTGEPTPLLANVPTNFVDLSDGDFFSCGLDAGGNAFCWGQNKNGNLGVDPVTTTENCREFSPTITSTCSSTAVQVSGGHTFAQIDAGTNNACGLTTDGEIWCWGRGDLGALGDGTGFGTSFSFTPVKVVDPM